MSTIERVSLRHFLPSGSRVIQGLHTFSFAVLEEKSRYCSEIQPRLTIDNWLRSDYITAPVITVSHDPLSELLTTRLKTKQLGGAFKRQLKDCRKPEV